MKRLLFSIVLLEAIFTVTSARPTAEAMALDSLPSDLKIAALFQQTLTHFPPDKSAAVRQLEHKARIQKDCGVVCAIFCPFGNVLDENGCPICQCRPPSTTGVAQVLSNKGVVCGPVCLVYCPFGNVLDANGCPTCRCNQEGNVQFQAVAGISVDGLQRNAKAQHNFESLMNILAGEK